jgi:capsular polysaccharide biosynthesis protein
MARSDVRKWRSNRSSTLLSKFKRWRANPVGGFVRLLEFLYFGQPIFNFFIGNKGDLEQISQISKSLNTTDSDQNLIFLNNVRVDLNENFIQLDSGHVLNSRLAANAIFSGEQWNLIRNVRKSKENKFNAGRYYSISHQRYFFHFLLEELPEIISADSLDLDISFVTLKDQPKFVSELCQLAGINLQVVNHEIQLFEELVTPSYLRAYSNWSIEQLKLLSNQLEAKDSSFRKILLLRQGKARSDDAFERFLENLLTPLGYRVLDPEKHSNLEQIEIFLNATEIVAIHGAALSNLVFTNSDCKIFEIFNHPYRTYFFRDLAKLNGNSYTSCESPTVQIDLQAWLDK